MPIGMINSLVDNQRSAKFNRKQIEWNKSLKQIVWQRIIKHKILLQSIVLYMLGKKVVVNDYKQYLGFLIINKILEINKEVRLVYNDIIPEIYENCIKSLI